jgi:hypothetical protein
MGLRNQEFVHSGPCVPVGMRSFIYQYLGVTDFR